MFGLTPEGFANQLYIGLTGYVTLVIISIIASFVMVQVIQRRVATFMLVTFGMFTEFLILFYGINIGVPHFTELETIVGFNGIFAGSLIASLLVILITAAYLRWILAPESSVYERENEALTEDELAPFDHTRREYMKRRKETTGRGKGV